MILTSNTSSITFIPEINVVGSSLYLKGAGDIYLGVGGGCVPRQNLSNQIGFSSSYSYIIPSYGLYDYGWTGQIWDQSEMGTTKQITGFEMFQGDFGVLPYSIDNQIIKMGHVSQSIFTSTPQLDLSDMTITNLKTVKNSFTHTPTQNDVWNTFTFDDNFCYNGIDNLILIWENRDGTWDYDYGYTYYTTATNKVAYKYQDTTFPTGTGFRSSNRNNIKFIY